MKNSLGEDPRRVYKREMISQENQQYRGVYTQLSDGSVPSFEDFKTIKDKIILTNKGIGKDMSLVKRNEEVDKTLEQYM